MKHMLSAGTDSAGRRMMLWGLLRGALMSALMLVVYYLLPLDRRLDIEAAVGLVVGLVAFVVLVAWQIEAIARSERPRLRAFEAVAVSLPFLLVLFAATYFLIDSDQADSFTEPMSRTDALYFTVTVFATVGFGDIAPRTEAARVVTTIQMLVDLVALGVIARVILGAVRVGLRRQSGGSDGDAIPDLDPDRDDLPDLPPDPPPPGG
ncbi:potassium channel family protein (plasmid) [Embleya sp. NBC_00888]|uniref:potassium channel family protein n=1 Tax=Embleya sp. NBC_00888 TaxID=2975960 RepID=UPI002F91367E|nr:potassium channel family protein [Embleya sp. NBC_00888]